MFSYQKRIDRAYRAAEAIRLSDATKLVIMSDIHRGGGNWADDFAKNQLVYHAALKSYYRQRYTYIELGDGDELWKSNNFREIAEIHKDIFILLQKYFREDRLYFLYGNHDLAKKYKPGLLDAYYDESENALVPLFPGIRVYESLLLTYGKAGREMLLLHGHQADFLNSTLWRLARFLVRHVWKPLELIGFDDPTSANKNNKVKEKVEKRLLEWAEKNNKLLMAGHTHRPVFPEPRAGAYFNDGSCVRPWSITAVEISAGSIALVKWSQKTHEDGTVYTGKDVIAGPRRLTEYFV